MIWLELRTNNAIYNPGWNFSESVWAPILKENGGNWPFWNLLSQVVRGDIIFHLRNVNGDKKFLGYSTAFTDGYVTGASPTEDKHQWDFVKFYHKIELTDYQPLNPPVSLSDFFNINDLALRKFFNENREKQIGKKRLFYVIQSSRLQCLNGAYFSEFETILSSMLAENYGIATKNVEDHANTGVSLRELKQRIGHQEFSDNVKSNFENKCCYPNCEVQGNEFLISGHIARWADNEVLRGHTGNGLCLCLMHDKAFERGLFTIDEGYKVVIVKDDLHNTKWLNQLLCGGQNLVIKARQINPLLEALKGHWQRIGYIRK